MSPCRCPSLKMILGKSCAMDVLLNAVLSNIGKNCLVNIMENEVSLILAKSYLMTVSPSIYLVPEFSVSMQKMIWQQAQWATNQLVFSPFVGTVHVTISLGAQSSWLKSKVNLWSVIILLIRESPIYPISCLWSTSSKSNLRQITCLSHAPKHLNVML